MGTAITLKFVLTPAEYAEVVRQRILRGWGFRGTLFLAAVATVSPLLLYVLSNAVNDLDAPDIPFRPETLWYSVVGLAFAGYLLVWFPAQTYRNMNPANRDQEQEYRFTEDGVNCRHATAESKLEWNTLLKFVETREFFLLHPQLNIFYPIPKRSFASGQEIDAFRELLKRKIPRS